MSRAWRKVKTDWEAWCARGLAEEDIVRLILDGTVVKARIDRKATAISVLAAIGVRRDGPEGPLGDQEHGRREHGGVAGVPRRPRRPRPEGAGLRHRRRRSGPRGGVTELWPDAPVQRCTVHKHRNLLAHAPKSLHDELTEDYRDMIYAETKAEIARRRTTFLRKWRLKCRAVADSLEEAGDRLFTFTRSTRRSGSPPGRPTPSSACTRSSDAGSRPRRSCPTPRRRRCWSGRFSASGQIVMRKVDGMETLSRPYRP